MHLDRPLTGRPEWFGASCDGLRRPHELLPPPLLLLLSAPAQCPQLRAWGVELGLRRRGPGAPSWHLRVHVLQRLGSVTGTNFPHKCWTPSCIPVHRSKEPNNRSPGQDNPCGAHSSCHFVVKSNGLHVNCHDPLPRPLTLCMCVPASVYVPASASVYPHVHPCCPLTLIGLEGVRPQQPPQQCCLGRLQVRCCCMGRHSCSCIHARDSRDVGPGRSDEGKGG